MRRSLIVFAGGGLGAGMRAILLAWLAPLGATLPIPVLLVNLLGAFVLGAVFVLADEAGMLGAETRLFLAVGVLGGFTTFSTFGWGTDLLLSRRADWFAAAIYIAASVVGGLLAVQGGVAAGREIAASSARGVERVQERGLRQSGDATRDIASIEAEDREASS